MVDPTRSLRLPGGAAVYSPSADHLVSVAQRELDRMADVLRRAEAELAITRQDMAAAAGEMTIPIPEPGSAAARLLAANVLLRAKVAAMSAGEVPRRFDDWGDDDGAVLWWDTSMTGGEITEPTSYVGGPTSSDWPFEDEDGPHLLWVPHPKLARGRP